MSSANPPAKRTMRVTTVRFGPDLWQLLEAEAALAGISVSEYIREASLARAVAAASVRDEDPFTMLAGGIADPDQPAAGTPLPEHAQAAAPELRHDPADRSSEVLSSARAAIAESQQTRRRSRQLKQRG